MNETPDSDIIGKAKTELRDLLVIVAPNLTPMDTLSGLISQINNVLAWLRDQIPKTTNEGRALPAEPFIMRLGMNFTITPKNVILWPKEKATGRSALGVFEDAIAALLQPSTPPAELAALRAKADSFDAIWAVCVELGMQVNPPGVDADGERIDEEWANQFAFLRGLAEQVKRLRREQGQVSQYVEGTIAMRTKFDGNPPYVGWKGLGLALEESLDERDDLRAQLTAAVTRAERAEGALETLRTMAEASELFDMVKVADDALEGR
jgi:hypothetical protein